MVEDNLVTFIGAGHETTARALGWTLYLLNQSPAERGKVGAELDGLLATPPEPADWPDALPRTRAVFEEAMRLYPPAPSLNRWRSRTTGSATPRSRPTLRCSRCPGSSIATRNCGTARRCSCRSAFSPENRGRIGRYAYLPFGLGPRVCIGASFAMQEGVIALASRLRRLHFDYAGDAPPVPVQRITAQPKRPLRMRVTRR